MATNTTQKKMTSLATPKYQSEYGMLYGAVGYIGGEEVTVTHRNPETGELWCEYSLSNSSKTGWYDADKVSFSKNPTT